MVDTDDAIKICELQDMKLHYQKQFGKNLTVLKVPNGWIYTYKERMFCSGVGDQIVMTSTFVPEKI